MADHHHSLTSTDGTRTHLWQPSSTANATPLLYALRNTTFFSCPVPTLTTQTSNDFSLATFVVGATVVAPSASNRRLSLVSHSQNKTLNLDPVESLNPLLIARWINHIANDLDTANARARSVSLSPSKQMPFSNPMNLPMDQKKSGKRPAPRSLLNPRVKIRETKDTAFVSDDEDD